MPACNRRANRCARCRSRVHRPPPRPYSVPFAMASASSSCAKVHTVTNGPNTSSCDTRSPGCALQRSSARRSSHWPSAGLLGALPPVSTRPPCFARDVDVGQHAVAVLLRGERSHLGVGSSGSPMRIDAASAMNRSRNSSAMRFVQDQPRTGDARLALVVEDRRGRAIAPRHRDSRRRRRCSRPCRRVRAARVFRLPCDACTILRPIAVEPVNAILLISGCSARCWPAVWPSPARC